MQIGHAIRKRLNREGVEGNQGSHAPVGLLAITDAKGEDLQESASPSNSSSSKKAKVDIDGVSGNRSAGP